MNKTKIIATIGPASQDEAILEQLVRSGMDIARINMAHSDHDFVVMIKDRINKINKKLNKQISIMLDITGPEIRTGELEEKEVKLIKNEKIRIYKKDIIGNSKKISVDYPLLIEEVVYGTIIKIDDGKIELKVIDKELDYITCLINTAAKLRHNQSVVVVDHKLSKPYLSEKDLKDIKFASTIGIDFLTFSFIRNLDDILIANDAIIELGNDHIGLIAKIETEGAINEIDEIIKLSDGVMIARGDLGVHIPVERIPGLQKQIINKCHRSGKISIVATELLSSMEEFMLPTKAEVSDVANAVLDGVDAVMLAGETTIGKYPVETVEMMERIMSASEKDIDYEYFLDKTLRTENKSVTGLIAHSVADCASRLGAVAIIIPTNGGYTAEKISRFRPSCPIIAVSTDEKTVKKLTLNFGVHPFLIDDFDSLDDITKISKEIVKRELNPEKGQQIVITGGYPFKEVKYTNFMKIDEL